MESCSIVSKDYKPKNSAEERIQNCLENIKIYFKNPTEYENFPRGYLMIDEKGKKSREIVEELAEQENVPLFILKSVDFENSSELKKVLDNIQKKSKAIAFIEKLDTLAPVIHGPMSLEKFSKSKSINKFLSEMNSTKSGIIFFASVKSLNSLDPSASRPGRFDHYLNLFPPKKVFQYSRLDTWQYMPLSYKLIFWTFAIAYFSVIYMYLKGHFRKPAPQPQKNEFDFVEKCNVKFENVQGCDEVKAQLFQIVDFLKHPEAYEKFGAVMPRGYLLSGPPGVGKTMLALAVAGEAQVTFLSVSGSQFEEMYLGVGAARVRALFNEARKFDKAVIFIDEIDAVAGKRGAGFEAEQSSRRQTLNQLLVEMDGFKTGSNIVILAATNTPENLDPAILRPGRFDQTLTISPPDIEGRKRILERLLRTIPAEKLAEDVEVEKLAQVTIGFTGADLTNFVNRAKLIASNDVNASVISKSHFKQAKDFISFGPERQLAMTREEKEQTAYHEAGHAIVALVTPGSFPVRQATIIPHGNTIGLVLTSPDKDINHMTLNMLEAKIDMYLGGFLAEEFKYGYRNVSTAAASDIKSVNELARTIVNSGFGERTRFLQPQNLEGQQNSEKDVTDILERSRTRVKNILKEYESAWEAIAEALIEHENLTGEQLKEILEKNQPRE